MKIKKILALILVTIITSSITCQTAVQVHAKTEEAFDSSMVWYTREAQELTLIYANLEKRFRLQHNHTETLLKSRGEQKMQFTAEGDSINVWNQDELLWLTEAPLMNKVTFELKADTNFYPKDMFVWDVDFHFFREGRATMGLNVVFENDSVIGETRQITESGRQTIRLTPDSAYQIKQLNGFIYVPEDSTAAPSMLLHNISLMRYHQEGADTLTTSQQLPPLVEDKPDKKRLKKMQPQ